MSEPSPNLRAFTPEEWKIVAGIYRRLGELTKAIRISSAKPAPAAEPTQATLDLEPGSIAREIAAKPRVWGNTVRAYRSLWAGCGDAVFDLQQIVQSDAVRESIREATKGKVGVASYSRILSTLHRAGAVFKVDRSHYRLAKPTDELCDRVERFAKKRKEVAA